MDALGQPMTMRGKSGEQQGRTGIDADALRVLRVCP